jgi:hypothetical protein
MSYLLPVFYQVLLAVCYQVLPGHDMDIMLYSFINRFILLSTIDQALMIKMALKCEI